MHVSLMKYVKVSVEEGNGLVWSKQLQLLKYNSEDDIDSVCIQYYLFIPM